MLLVAGLSHTTHAASDSWNVDASGVWTNAANWVGGNIPGITGGSTNMDVATFSLTLTAARTNTVDANRNLGGITFGNTSANAYTLSGGNLILSSGGVIQTLAGAGAHDDTISSAIKIAGNGGSANFRNDAATGTGLLIKGAVSGSSTAGNTTILTLDGSSTDPNTYVSGAISDGTNGGKLAVLKNEAGMWTLTGNNTFTGGLTFNGGTIKYFADTETPFGRGLLTISGGVTFNHGNGSPTIITNQMVVDGNFTMGGRTNTQWGGTMDLNAGVRTITVSVDSKVASIISNGGLIKAGANSLTLTSTNTYSGSTTVSQGALIANTDGALGNSDTITVRGGTTLTLTNGVSNNYMNDSAVLVLATNSTLNLGFTGTDTVASLSLDGGGTWLAANTYNTAGLTAAGGKGIYAGAGSLAVLSEPPRAGLTFVIEHYIEPLNVYVCAGQSNMAGGGTKAGLPAELQAVQTNVFVFNGADWDAMEPTATGVGPEISFAYEMQKVLNKPIGIIMHAVGGTSLATNWNPEIAANLYAELTDKVNAARQSKKMNVKGMIWMQGENDSRYLDMATAYSHNLTNLILAARTDFNSPSMPFVAGRVNPPVSIYKYVDLVRAAQETCTVPLYAYINCDDLTKDSGGLHYDTAGLVEMGKRFALSIQDLQ